MTLCPTPLAALVLPPLPTPPNWCPDITLIHGARDGNHVLAIVDVTCPSVVTRAALPAAFHMPLATAIAATASKHARYGNVHPHTVLPFVVEHAGGINKEGMQFFRMCRAGLNAYPENGRNGRD